MKHKTDNTLFSYRRLNFAGLFLTGSSLVYATISLEQQLSTINCSLCSIVRLCLLCMSLVFFIAFIHNPWSFGQRIYALLNWLLCVIGLVATGRYIWLESLQPDKPALCNMGIDTWIESLPFLADFFAVLTEQNDCLNNSWHLFGLTLSQVTMVIFVCILLITWQLLTRRPERKLFF